jgi:hypothetical protein
MHLSKSRVPVIQSIMHVAALATRSSMSPTPSPLEIRVTDPVRLDDGTTAAGRAGSNLVEISGYKPGDQHTEPSVTEAAETIIHELTHWISFGMYSGNRVDGGNPPWLTDDRLNKRKGNKAVDTTKDKEENAERIQSVTYAIEDIGDATLDGDLNVLSGVQSTAQHSKYKELMPYTIEFLARLDNNNKADQLDQVLASGDSDLTSVKRVAEQFGRDLERYKRALKAKDDLKSKPTAWAAANAAIW